MRYREKKTCKWCSIRNRNMQAPQIKNPWMMKKEQKEYFIITYMS